jgi:hypothetical protein
MYGHAGHMYGHAGLDLRDCNTVAKCPSILPPHLTRISLKRRVV